MDDRSLVEVVFFAALEKGTPAERAAYLDEACAGNEALRRRVEALLAAHAQAGQFLERPVVEAEGMAAAGGLEGAAADLSFLAPPSEPGSLGRLDHYDILEVVGRGGTGIVLRARDTKLLRVVALKALAAPLAASGTARQRFAREARAAAAVRDDHVIDIHAVADRAPVPYLVMEFIDGCNLEALIRRGGPLEIKEILRIGTQVASGLAAAHMHGLIHRDVKPANILLENGVQRVKLTDFGLARAVDDASLTQSGLIAGTPQFMSPEQANGEPIDHRSDLFSLGSVLYEMCTGRPAFRAPNTAAVLRRVSDAAPRPIREVNPDVPAPLCQMIERLQAKRPVDRPASAKEVADLLAGLLADLNSGRSWEPSGPSVLPSPVRLPRPTRRLWLWVAAALVLLVAGLSLGQATGVTDVRGTAIRLLSPDGTLVVEVDDPDVSVALDGADVVITGAGVKEVRLRPGQHQVEASKDGKLVSQERVTVTRNGRQVVRISKEAEPPAAADPWEKSVAALPADEQVEAVARRLTDRNPRFTRPGDPPIGIEPTIRDGVVVGLKFNTDRVEDLSPVRALPRLESLDCCGSADRNGMVADLSPLRGLPLRRLIFSNNQVIDLSPLHAMPLKELRFRMNLSVKDLAPLRGMPLEFLECSHTGVADLAPLKGMRLTVFRCDGARLVSDLTPLQGMPLKELRFPYTQVSDLKPLRGMPLEVLTLIDTPVSDLSPLQGMSLKDVSIDGSKVTDLSPLRGMPLTRIRLSFRPERDTEMVRSLTMLQVINEKPAADFWREVGGQ